MSDDFDIPPSEETVDMPASTETETAEEAGLPVPETLDPPSQELAESQPVETWENENNPI